MPQNAVFSLLNAVSLQLDSREPLYPKLIMTTVAASMENCYDFTGIVIFSLKIILTF